MRFSLILESMNGFRISLSHTANNYMTSKIDGLGPPNATVATSAYAGTGGSYLNNAFIEKRNIVINFEMRGIDIEKRRQLLYKVATPSQYVKIFYQTTNTNVYSYGYVETCEINNFEIFTSGQISIICPDIYWYGKQIISSYEYQNAFRFPFPESDEPFTLGGYNDDKTITVENDGDPVGFTIEITAETSAETVTVYNADTGEYLRINGDIQPNDIITITTHTGNKTISLNRGGFSTNIINWFVYGSTWLTMNWGVNRFRLEAPENISARIIHINAYLGV